MIVLDTHAWLWFTADEKRLSQRARKVIMHSKRRAIAAISCYEFAALIELGRVQADRDPLEWIESSLVEHDIELLPLSPAVAIRATQLGNRFPRDPADRQIAATALIHGAKLVTRDEKIRDSGAVETIW